MTCVTELVVSSLRSQVSSLEPRVEGKRGEGTVGGWSCIGIPLLLCDGAGAAGCGPAMPGEDYSLYYIPPVETDFGE